ncbi:DeoR/GlpR family DNA-binding transcription regulator [Tessaracoccus lacteus]|uniref:DeoR/GlpR family DNA-binding transcription regulator n=1 Tax=Tessaracoccus lacteus TaxID=3041766 RepID=A0ABY8PWM1_9ACTN|nr:DeoR/GlpR family DNA-binding transcription regulator [Tessaracoccus sp. T21]WGT46823.1 DeoR/GlpR family DNA-binding transcription regulator [Tessaracoccus sp. T21]
MTQERASREEAILTRLTDDGTLTVASMAEKLGVSEVTIRGDLRALEQRGMLVRTRGGARPSSFKTILQREKVNVEAKQRIAAFAASMITDGDTVMMEAGTTVASITGHLAQRRDVQIVTNSTLVFNVARTNPALNIILAGGVFRRESESLVGPDAERTVSDFNTRLAFLGTDGFSPERGLTTRFVDGAQVAALMSRRAEETWLVADSSKFGQAGFVSFLPLDKVTGIITDSGLVAGAAEALQEHTRVCIV